MKKELKKPMHNASELRVKAYAGEACVNGDGNTEVSVNGSQCPEVNGICINIFCWDKD